MQTLEDHTVLPVISQYFRVYFTQSHRKLLSSFWALESPNRRREDFTKWKDWGEAVETFICGFMMAASITGTPWLHQI